VVNAEKGPGATVAELAAGLVLLIPNGALLPKDGAETFGMA
jgi:hypothetical protein